MTSPPIVVPLDGSHDAEVVLPFAQELAAALPADLRLVHVLPPSSESAGLADDNLQFYIRRLEERCDIPASCWLPAVTAATAAGGILGAASDAGLLALASHGQGGFRAATVGSVADRVVRQSHVPVLFVPVRAGSAPLAGRPIIAGLDGSAASEHAAELARRFAKALAAPVHLVEAYSAPAILRAAAIGIDLLGIMRGNIEESLTAAVLPGETSAVLHGAAHEVLLEEAERLNAGIIAVGMQGEGLTTRLLRGSTTDRLMHTTRRPLLAVPLDAE